MSRASERLELVRAVATFFRSIVQEEDQSRQDILNRFLPRILTAAPSSSSSSVFTAAAPSSRSGEEGATSSPTRTQQQQQQQSPPQSEHKDSPDRSAFLDEGSSQTDPPSISAAGEKTTMTVVVPPHGARRRSTVKMSDEALIDLSIPTHHQPMHRRPTDSAAAIDAHSLSAFLAQSQLSTGAASAMDASQSVMSSDPADGEAGKPSVVFEVMPPKDPLASSASFMVDRRTKPAASSSRQQQETDEHRKDDPFDSSVLSLSDGGRRRLSKDVAPQTTTSASLSEKKTGLAALPDALRIGLTISQSLEHDNRYDIIHEESDCFKQILQEHRESFFHLTKSLREGQLCDRLQMERCLTLRLVQLVVRWERERQYMDSLELARRAWHHKREGARLHLAALEAEERDMVVTRDELQRSQWQRLERNTRLEILQREQELYNEEDDDGMDLEGEGSLGALVHVLS